MRTRFIHDEFEIDISHLELNWTEENTWFKDEFFLNSSFPFELEFSEVPFFDTYRHLNSSIIEVFFQGKLEKDGKIEDAILELEEADEKLRMTIRYGVEALSNWTKNLSELELEVVLPNGGNMRTHAQDIISKTYPETNYNFPAIHSKYYEGAAMFDHFEGTINKRENGVFVENIQNGAETENRNIVYPFPYHLYVLKSAVEDAGYILKGDILEDPDLKDAIIVPGKKIAEFETLPKPVEWEIGSTDQVGGSYWYPIYKAEMEINYRGTFGLYGILILLNHSVTIKLNGNLIYSYSRGMSRGIDLIFTTNQANNLLEIDIIGYRAVRTIASLVLETYVLHDGNGNPLPFLANFSKVQLADKLPDMTVGEFIKFHKRLKNYDFDLRNNNEIWMNLINNEIENTEIVDVSELQPLSVKRRFEQSKSFVLQYEFEHDEHKFRRVFADKTGFRINDFEQKENTEEININGIPLPILREAGITTAVQITDDESKLMLAKYNGLLNGNNWARSLKDLDCYNLYINYWQQWLNFMIHSVKFSWTVQSHPNSLIKIQRKSKLYSFNSLSFVFSLNRKRKGNVEEIAIEAYSTKI